MSQNYTPTKWVDNRTVGTASVMNNMEKGIKNAHDRIDGFNSQIKDIVYNIKNYGAKSDGSEDISSILQNLINEIPNGSKIQFENGKYLLVFLTFRQKELVSLQRNCIY